MQFISILVILVSITLIYFLEWGEAQIILQEDKYRKNVFDEYYGAPSQLETDSDFFLNIIDLEPDTAAVIIEYIDVPSYEDVPVSRYIPQQNFHFNPVFINDYYQPDIDEDDIIPFEIFPRIDQLPLPYLFQQKCLECLQNSPEEQGKNLLPSDYDSFLYEEIPETDYDYFGPNFYINNNFMSRNDNHISQEIYQNYDSLNISKPVENVTLKIKSEEINKIDDNYDQSRLFFLRTNTGAVTTTEKPPKACSRFEQKLLEAINDINEPPFSPKILLYHSELKKCYDSRSRMFDEDEIPSSTLHEQTLTTTLVTDTTILPAPASESPLITSKKAKDVRNINKKKLSSRTFLEDSAEDDLAPAVKFKKDDGTNKHSSSPFSSRTLNEYNDLYENIKVNNKTKKEISSRLSTQNNEMDELEFDIISKLQQNNMTKYPLVPYKPLYPFLLKYT